jgi:hypothetical protein
MLLNANSEVKKYLVFSDDVDKLNRDSPEMRPISDAAFIGEQGRLLFGLRGRASTVEQQYATGVELMWVERLAKRIVNYGNDL